MNNQPTESERRDSMASDAEDVNDFLKRIQEMGSKRDQEDEERNKRLEEEILQGRRERAARRAERARSISPQKESPVNTPQSYKYTTDHTNASHTQSETAAAALTPSRELQYQQQQQSGAPDDNEAQESLEDTMDRLTGARSPRKETTSSIDNNGVESMRNSPSASSAMPTRSGTVSWQQRPKSRGGRALSVIASENAAEKSLRSTPEPARSRPTSSNGEPLGRDAIAQSLGSKTPDFFRQSADSGRGSGAFRKNQVEDSDTVEGHTGDQRMQLPGMESSQRKADAERSLSPSRADTPSGRPTSSHGYSSYKRGSTAGLEDETSRSRASTLTSHRDSPRLPPPGATDSPGEPAMSPAQGRMSSPERQRPVSPTKGMGGFVQSAMMKRNDSVNKRWSVQSPSTRSPHAALNRQSVDLGSTYASPRDRPTSMLSRDTTSELSRPSSSHSNTTYTTRDADQSRPSSSYYEQPSSDSPTKSLPVLDPHKHSFDDLPRPETPRPLSPSKTGGDKPRWSPTKSSWLESALKKPESSKVRPAAPAAQPSWMEGISKAKLNPEQEPTNGAAKVESAPALKHKHQVSIEGLIRSPGMGASEKPKNISALAAKFSSGVGSPAEKRKESFRDDMPSGRSIIEERKKSFANLDVGGLGKSPLSEKKPSITSLDPDDKPLLDEPTVKEAVRKTSIESAESVKSEEPIARSVTPKAVEPEAKPSPAPVQSKAASLASRFEPKPLAHGKFDFRGNLKPKAPPPSNTGTNEPEFKNVFGQLKRTKTQKYEVPDVLKDNILRGKSGLAQTGGPQKTERKDEFKEAILEKKKAFEKAQAEGTAVGLTKTPSQVQRELPEALAKKAALGRSGSSAKIVDVPSREPPTSERPKRPEELPFRERAKSFANPNGEQSGLQRSRSTISVKRDASPQKDENENKTAAPLGVSRSYSTKRVDEAIATAEAPPESSPEKSDAPPRHRRAKSISAKAGMFERQQPEAPLKKPSFEVPKRTIVQKDEFGPPLRRKTEQPKEEEKAFTPPSLAKEDSAPGRLQGKTAIGNKLAERFNPALANLLARGPPAQGSESPVKSTSTSAPVTEVVSEESSEGPKLEHKTKSRARGPKRKAPSTAAAAIAVPSESKPFAAEAPKPRPLPVPQASPLKDEQTRDTPSLRSRFMEEPKLAEATQQAIAEAGSPRKLNIKRRSQFLAGEAFKAPATPTKEDHGFDGARDSITLEKRSPAKNHLVDVPSQRNSMQSKDERRNFSPTVKPKPLSLVSPPIDAGRFDPLQRSMTPPARVMTPTKTSFDLGNFDFETTKAAPEEEQRRPSIASIPSSEHGTFGSQAKQAVSSQRPTSVMSSIASPQQEARRYEMSPPAPAPVQREPTRATSPPSRAGTFGMDYKPYVPNPAGRKISNISNTSEASYNNDKVDSESISSVRSTKSMFGQARADNVQRSPSVKAPIKLPTHDDENAAMVNAGLRSPTSDSYSQRQQSMSPALSRTSTREQPQPPQQQQQQHVPREFAHMREASRELPQPPQREQSSSPVYARQPFHGSGRPLPIPPLRISKTPPPAAPQPLSPTKSIHGTGSLLSSRADTSKTLQEFFNSTDAPKNFNIDTGTIIEMRPDFNSPIHTLSAAIYQIGQDGKKQNVPRGQERILFEGNMYLCTHVFTRPEDPNRKITEIYFWIGDEVPETLVYDAEVMALKEAKAVRGEMVKLRQGKETPEFIDALEGIIVVHRGVAHRFDATRPMMLCARSYAGRIVFDEVDYSPLSLCSGYPYIVSTSSGKCYLWKGRGSGVDELSSARLIGMDYGMTGEIIEVEDGRESQYFLDEFGRGTVVYKSAEHWRLKPLYELYSTRLFVADTKAAQKVRSSLSSNASLPPPSPSSWSPLAMLRSRANTPEPKTEADERMKHQIVEIAPFKQADMDPRHIYVLDAFFELYIIVGKESKDKYDDFCAALVFAQEYGILTAGMEDRPFVPVSTVVLEGVPRDMKGVFRKWRDNLSPLIMKPRTMPQQGGMGGSLKRGKSLRVVRLNDALDAVRL